MSKKKNNQNTNNSSNHQIIPTNQGNLNHNNESNCVLTITSMVSLESYELLKRENDQLKLQLGKKDEEINHLQNKIIVDLEEKIAFLEKENKSLRDELNELKRAFNKINRDNEVRNLREFITKLITAIQDINMDELLEQKICDKNIVDNLVKLRSCRNGTNHYFYKETLSLKDKNIKKYFLRNILETLDDDCINTLEYELEIDEGRGKLLVNELIKQLNKNSSLKNITIDERSKEKIKYFFGNYINDKFQ
jgi:hypothetical protein